MDQSSIDTAPPSANGKARPVALSSTSTLFWRIFVPAFSTAILTAAVVVLCTQAEDDLYLDYPILWYRIVAIALWAAWIFLMYKTLWRLLRIDVDPAFVYVTDYWTAVRYPWADVAALSESKRLGRKIAHIHLRGTGKFGNKISFLPNKDYQEWLKEHQKTDVTTNL